MYNRIFHRRRLTTYLIIFFYWFLNVNLVSIFVIMSLDYFLTLIGIDKESLTNSYSIYMTSWNSMIETLIFPVLMTILFIVVNAVGESRKWDRYHFGKIILLKSAMYFVGMFIIILLMSTIVVSLGFIDPEDIQHIEEDNSMYLLAAISGIVYIAFQVIILNFIVQTTKNAGGNNLIQFITGKYHSPKLENKIFLFLDLKSSTTYAEKLGSIKYSSLIKDCFQDLNLLINRYEADIYQYVGDEIVLTWDMEDGLKNLNFIGIFFEFKNAILKRKSYYINEYGLIPEFKAGANGGKITVNEVGNIKREIAFHGDVINTAARIQSICNTYQKQFLISGKLLRNAGHLNGFEATDLGEIQLRGKEKTVQIYSIENNSEP